MSPSPPLGARTPARLAGAVAAVAAIVSAAGGGACGPGAFDPGDPPPPCVAAPAEAVGVNAYHLVRAELGRADGDVDAAMDEALSVGAGLVRTWAFDEVRPPEWRAALLRVADAARQRGLRLVLTLSNHWGDYGGAPALLRRAGLNPDDMHAFFTAQATEHAWREAAAVAVDALRADPVVAAWELMNEPRCPHCDPDVVRDWLARQAAWLAARGAAAPVWTGEEGWLAGDGEGVDFDRNTAIGQVGAGSMHLYPAGWGARSTADAILDGRTRIAAMAARSRALGKPLVLGEVGWPYAGCPAADPDCTASPDHVAANDALKAAVLAPLLAQARADGLRSVFVWRLAEPPARDWDHLGVTPSRMPRTRSVICEAARSWGPG